MPTFSTKSVTLRVRGATWTWKPAITPPIGHDGRGVGGERMQKNRTHVAAAWAAAALSSACFLLLTVAVARGLLDGLDRSILAFLRPDYEWRRGQVAWNWM